MCEVFELSSFKLTVPPQKAFVWLPDQKASINWSWLPFLSLQCSLLPKDQIWILHSLYSVTNLLHPHTRSCCDVLLFWAGWHRGSLSLAEGQADTLSSLAAAWVTTQHWWELCPWGYSFRQLSCERTAHKELCHCPGLSLEQRRYHCRELGQPSPLLGLSPTALAWRASHRNVILHRMCCRVCTPLPQNAPTRSADIPAVTAVCIKDVGRGCHEHRGSHSCPPTPEQPTQAHHMPGRKALCGLALSAQGEQLFPWGHTEAVTDARDACRYPYPKPAIQPQPYPLLWFGRNLQVFHHHFLLY